MFPFLIIPNTFLVFRKIFDILNRSFFVSYFSSVLHRVLGQDFPKSMFKGKIFKVKRLPFSSKVYYIKEK